MKDICKNSGARASAKAIADPSTQRYDVCPVCKSTVSVTKSNRLRRHIKGANR